MTTSSLNCYFENQPEFQQQKKNNLKLYSQINIYDAINIDEVPDEYIIEFYCEYKNSKGHITQTFHRRNVLDLFSILEHCISPITVSYSHGEGAYEYDTFNDACDPVSKYEFSKQQIEYIRQRRKEILCNPLLKAVINRFASIGEKELQKTIKDFDISCSNLLLNAIYCPESNNKNSFMLKIIETCKNIEPRLILYSAEEDINYKVFNAMIKKISKETLSRLLNEKGETLLDIVQVNPTENNKNYDIDDIMVVAPLIFTAVVNRDISPKDRYKLVKKLINNGVNVNVKFKGYSPLFMAIYTYTAPDSKDEEPDYDKMIIDLLEANGAK